MAGYRPLLTALCTCFVPLEGVSGLARKFGLTPDQFGENLRDNYQRHETQQHPLEPEDTAENYLSRSVNVESNMHNMPQ